MKKLLLLSALLGAMNVNALSMELKIGALGGMTTGSVTDKTKTNSHKIAEAHGLDKITSQHIYGDHEHPVAGKNLFHKDMHAEEKMKTSVGMNFAGFLDLQMFSQKTSTVDYGFGLFAYFGKMGLKSESKSHHALHTFDASGFEFFGGPSVAFKFSNRFTTSLVAGVSTFNTKYTVKLHGIDEKHFNKLELDGSKINRSERDKLEALMKKEFSLEQYSIAFALALVNEFKINDNISAVLMLKLIPSKTIDYKAGESAEEKIIFNEVEKQKDDVSLFALQVSAGVSYKL